MTNSVTFDVIITESLSSGILFDEAATSTDLLRLLGLASIADDLKEKQIVAAKDMSLLVDCFITKNAETNFIYYMV